MVEVFFALLGIALLIGAGYVAFWAIIVVGLLLIRFVKLLVVLFNWSRERKDLGS